MIASQRYEKIIEMVDAQGIKNIKELAEVLNVTEMTIRRDCEELEKQGKIIRVRGGVKSIKKQNILSSQDEKRMQDRTEFYNEKDLVCKKAATFVKEGDCIFLDGGTSIAPMVKYLKGKKVKIVTNSMLVANLFQDNDSELFLLGGKYITEYSMSVGAITLVDLEKFNFDYAFIGCTGVDIERNLIYTTDIDVMAVKEKAMQLAVKSYLLIDASKLSVKGFYSFIPYDRFDAVFCNDDVSIEKETIPQNFMLIDNKI